MRAGGCPEKLGYSPNGDFTIVVQGGEACTEHQMVPRADDIVHDDAVEVAGAEAVRRFLGITDEKADSRGRE